MQAPATATQQARLALQNWQLELRQDPLSANRDFQHSLQFHFPSDWRDKLAQYSDFAKVVSERIEDLCAENDERFNLPRLQRYDGIGVPRLRIVHHPHYRTIGELIYASKLLAKTAEPGGLLEALSLFYLSCHAGEARPPLPHRL